MVRSVAVYLVYVKFKLLHHDDLTLGGSTLVQLMNHAFGGVTATRERMFPTPYSSIECIILFSPILTSPMISSFTIWNE